MKAHDFAKFLLTLKNADIYFDNSDGEYPCFPPSSFHVFDDGDISFICLKSCGELDVNSLTQSVTPKLYSLRCFDNAENKLFQSWEFSDYLEYCDTLAHIFNEYNGERITGCYFQSVVVFSGGFELVIWEKRYE